MFARVLRATARSEQAALTMAALWGEQVGRFERTAPGFQGGVLLREGVCLLADLGQGARGRIVEVRLPPGRRLAPASPLVDRGGGAVARSEWFEDGEDARRRWEALAGDAARLDAAGFRARYRLP